MSRSRLRPYMGPIVALLVILALGAGTVYAAIPNSNGKYYACMTKSTGAVKMINYPKVKCGSGQKLISWNAQGPAGPQGVQGAQGPAGPAGPAGAAGITKITITPATTVSTASGGVGVFGSLTATCPAGKVVGGGFSQATYQLRVTDSRPEGATSWRVYWTKQVADDGPAPTITAYALCMTTDPGAVIAKVPANFTPAKKVGKK